MADRDYNWLLSAVADELHRADLAARIPDWVRMAESNINRKLNIYQKEVEISFPSEAGSRFIMLPTDFSSPIALYSRQFEPREMLTAVVPEQLQIDDDNQGMPNYWAVDGINIAFEKPTDQAYPLFLRYVRSMYLSSTNITNVLLENNPDLYLYGSLVHSAPYIRDDARISLWQSLFDDALRQVAAEASRSRSVAPLRTDLPISTLRIGYRYGRH